MMNSLLKVRLLGGILLVALIGLIAGDPPAAMAQRKKKKKQETPPVAAPDASKKPRVFVDHSTLPAGTKLSAEQLARHIDGLITKKLAKEGVEPSGRTTDEEFLRRLYLDLTGKIPTADQAVAFLDSKDPKKRAKLIDQLLAGKEFGRHQADIWQAHLLPRNSDNLRLRQYYPNLTKWLEEQFNSNVGWNKTVKDIICASGEVNKQGPVVYWIANATPDKATDNITRVFLGVQLQCAQCHNHPFTDFKQDEYWGMAAFFMRVGPDGNPKAAAKNKGTITVGEKVRPVNRKRLPESAKMVPARFLQGQQADITGKPAIRPILADWLTKPENPYFARAMVNRAWYQMFGRGIVNPFDDMIDANEPSHPELIADLAKQFAANEFDVKYLFRAICNSDTYQRSSRPQGKNADAEPHLFARMAVRPLSPEQLYDSITSLVGAGRQAGPKNKAAARGGNARDAFINFFSAEDGADPTEYQAGIPQVLRLMNAPQMNNASILAPIIRTAKNNEEAVEKLYLSVLARRPRSDEMQRITTYLSKNDGDKRQAFAGVLWALMNSSEFALNR